MRKPSGAPRRLGSSEKLYWVFAMQTGRPPKPCSSSCLNMRAAFLEVVGDALGSVGVIAAAVVVALTALIVSPAILSIARTRA